MSSIAPSILTRPQLLALTGQTTNTIVAAENAGHLESFLIGRRRHYRIEAVNAWIDFLEAQSKAGKPVAYRAGENKAGAK